ncbi:MAG: hypothetical protein EBV75_05740 [Acidimicrobiia bacterium]|nr:hypothetical protein [Acidimicrobiia bacterium]
MGWNEDFELSVVDKFMSWGKCKTDKNIAPTCVQSVSERFSSNQYGTLLVVLGPITRNSDIFGMLGVQSNGSYFKLLNDFICGLSSDIRAQTIVRLVGPKICAPQQTSRSRVSPNVRSKNFVPLTTIGR